jgi:hypothetical protein
MSTIRFYSLLLAGCFCLMCICFTVYKVHIVDVVSSKINGIEYLSLIVSDYARLKTAEDCAASYNK